MGEAYSPLRVVEFCAGIPGPLCGMHLRLLGADVTRVEPQGGDPSMAWGERAPGGLYGLVNAGKPRVREVAVAEADVLLLDEGRLALEAVVDGSPRPRLCVVFEREVLADGALAGSETVCQALLDLVSYVGDRWSGPARTGADIASVGAALAGSQAVLAWLLAPRSGLTVVRVSPLRALAALKTVIWAARAAPDEWCGSHVVARDRRVDAGYRVADGWVTIDFPHTARDSWERFRDAIGLGEPARGAGERWWETVGWGDDVDEARPAYEAALWGLTREQATELIRRHGGSSVPFLVPSEVLSHPQTRALGAGIGTLPWRMLAGRRTPALATPVAREHPARASATPNELPLANTRVVDFGVGGVGPFAGVLLAQLGADVVKVEAPNEFIHAVRPLSQGLASTYSALNVGKRSVTLDLKDDAERDLANRLVATADVVLENFRPGAMERLGLGYEQVAELNSRVVYCSASGFGSGGPLSRLQCTDPHIQAFAGWAFGNAGPDGAPRRTRYYALLDLVTAMVIAEAVLHGLYLRAHTGRGCHLEVSMLEAVVHLHWGRWVGQEGRVVCDRLFAPDGLFRTTDGWVAISAASDAEWRALVEALGSPANLCRERWRSNRGRLAGREELERELAAVLASASAQAWTLALGRAGVPVGRWLRDDEAVLRADLWEGDYLRLLNRHDRGALRGGGPPWRWEPPLPVLEAPSPGGDTDAVRANPDGFWCSAQADPAEPLTNVASG